MKKLLLLATVFVALSGWGATIKFYTDYPNGVPLDTDFFLYQRNASYINGSAAQVRTTWFTSPTFTGNGTISGTFGVGGLMTVGGNLVLTGIYYGDGAGLSNVVGTATTTYINNVTNNIFYNTNVAFFNNTYVTNITVEVPGGLTNLNLTPLTLMYADVNNAEASLPNAVGVLTNDGSGAIGYSTSFSFDEFDADTAYMTNAFTFLTNAPFLATDGDGKIVAGSGTISNNTTIVNNFSATYITNNTFYGTNLNFVSGKGNTLIITNVSIQSGGRLTNVDATASTIANYGSDKVLGSLANSYGILTNSGSAAGYNSVYPQGDGGAMTNLTYQYNTNAVTTGTLVFGQGWRTNIAADITLNALTLGPNGSSRYESLVLLVTNSDTAVHKITWPSGVFSGGVAAVSWITNGYWSEVLVDHFATLYTNAVTKN